MNLQRYHQTQSVKIQHFNGNQRLQSRVSSGGIRNCRNGAGAVLYRRAFYFPLLITISPLLHTLLSLPPEERYPHDQPTYYYNFLALHLTLQRER